MSYFLAIDLGTTGCRSILFDSDKNILAQCYEEYGLITPCEGIAEQDAQLWWKICKNTMKGAVSGSKVNGKEIKAISISSQGITIVPVNENFEPLSNAHSWLDIRAKSQTERIEKDFGEEMFKISGKPTLACYTLPKILWFQDNEPEIYKKAYKFLMPLDFLTAKLCGRCVTDHSMASGTLMYDIKECKWSKKILNKYGIDEKILPCIMQSGSVAGNILPEVAKEIGLSEKCVISVGAQDQKCAAFGAGLSSETVTVSLGTAAAVTMLQEEVKYTKIKNVTWCGYCREGKIVTEGVLSSAGTCLRWLRDNIYGGAGYDVIDKEAEDAIKRGMCVFFSPSLENGEAFFDGLSLASGRGEMAAAVMEGVAYEIRKLLEDMGDGGSTKKIVLFGGAAKSRLWCSIISNICGKEIMVPETAEAAGAGAAMLAAEAVGEVIAPLKCANSYTPQQNYDDKYEKYLSLKEKIV